jgi:hypothetical protein
MSHIKYKSSVEPEILRLNEINLNKIDYLKNMSASINNVEESLKYKIDSHINKVNYLNECLKNTLNNYTTIQTNFSSL